MQDEPPIAEQDWAHALRTDDDITHIDLIVSDPELGTLVVARSTDGTTSFGFDAARKVHGG